jgi:hypothetical protein
MAGTLTTMLPEKRPPGIQKRDLSLRANRVLTRRGKRTTASSARSIIRLETNHSGILNFLCGMFGWQKWSGIAAFPRVVRRDE